MTFHYRLARACCVLHCVTRSFLTGLVPSSQPELLCELGFRLSITHVCLVRRTGDVPKVHVVAPVPQNLRWLTGSGRADNSPVVSESIKL